MIRRFVKLPARAIQVVLTNQFQSGINFGTNRFIQAKITGVAPYHSTWTGSARFSNKVSANDCWKTTYVVVEVRLLPLLKTDKTLLQGVVGRYCAKQMLHLPSEEGKSGCLKARITVN